MLPTILQLGEHQVRRTDGRYHETSIETFTKARVTSEVEGTLQRRVAKSGRRIG